MDWRNPIEEFRDKYMSFKNVRGYKLCAIRFGYIPYSPFRVDEYRRKVREVLGDKVSSLQLELFTIAYRDMGVRRGIQPWISKYLNAKFSLCINASIWKGWLPLLHIGIAFHISDSKYVQIGGGFGAEGTVTDTNLYERATICGKLRIGDFYKEWTDGGNYDVYGFYEGVI